MRVPGHTLVYEGAPHVWNGRRYERAVRDGWGVGGEGKGLCSCGATSKVLTTGAARKRWHREHREAVALAMKLEGWSPERVLNAMLAVNPFVSVSTSTDAQGRVLVTVPFDDLCSFIEWICGSMAEHDLDGFVKEELARRLKIGGSET